MSVPRNIVLLRKLLDERNARAEANNREHRAMTDDVKATDAIALAHGWFKLLRGWYHVNAWQYFGYGNIPVCYRTSQELCEKEGLS